MWLLILPGNISAASDQDLENRVTDIVVNIAWKSQCFEVFDRYDVRELLKDFQTGRYGFLPDSVILAIGDSLICDEALIIDVFKFSQFGVPPQETGEEGEDERNFAKILIDDIFSTSDDDYSDNIQTELSVAIRNIDIITGKDIDRFTINVIHTGGTRQESREEALEKFKDAALHEIQLIYLLVSEVTAVDGYDVQLRLGSNIGITKNTLFEIVESDRMEYQGNEEIITPGKKVGLACVQAIGDSVHKSQMIRQWLPVETGYYAYEYPNKIHAIQLYFIPSFPEDYFYLGGQFHYSPLADWDFGANLRYMQVTDSYEGKDHGFGFGIFGSRKLFYMPALLTHLRLGMDLDLAFRQDDDGNTVTAPVFSGNLAISGSFMISKKSDIEMNIGYRLSTNSSSWTYSEDEDSYDAYWTDTPPVVNLSGFYFSCGYKFLLF